MKGAGTSTRRTEGPRGVVEGLLLLIVCVSYRCYHKKRVRLKLDTWILIPPMDEMVNDNGHGQRFVMCLFVSCYHFLLVAKGSEGERAELCVIM